MSKVTLEQVTEFHDQVRTGRITGESLHSFLDGKSASDWQKLFGHLRVLDSNINNFNFSLEPEDKLRPVIRKQFSDTANGYERLRWAESQGLELARPRAIGLELKADQMQPVVGCGPWRHRNDKEYVLVFCRDDDRPDVDLGWLYDDFPPHYVWLFSRKWLVGPLNTYLQMGGLDSTYIG